MPQLMPLMWVSSVIMVFLIVMIFLNLFFIKSKYLINKLDFNLLKESYLVKW